MLKRTAIAIAAYIPCWVVAHCVVMMSRGSGLSLGDLPGYFVLAWSFSAGELPSYIWLLSLALYAVVIAAFVLARWRRGRLVQPFMPNPHRGSDRFGR